MQATTNNLMPATRRRKSTAVARRSSRRGFASGLMLVMLVFLAGFIALGLNVSRLSQVQSQLRTVCQASALAGAAQLLDEGFLAGVADQRDDVAAVRLTAQSIAQRNFVDGRMVDLNPNPDNAPLGDIVVGSIEPLAWAGQPIALPVDITQAQGLNTVRVTVRLKLNTYNKVTLFCGALFGVLSADAASSAQATLDRRIAGFRPEPGVRVPVVPLCADYESWMKQATARCNAANDLYTVNYQTGEVLAGPDGIPEILLSTAAPQADTSNTDATNTDSATTDAASADASASADATDPADATAQQQAASPPPAWCRALALPSAAMMPGVSTPSTAISSTAMSNAAVSNASWSGTGANDPASLDVWGHRCRRGLGLVDLASLGGQLIVLPQGVTVVPTLTALPPELCGGLTQIVGSARAWSLAEPGVDETSCSIVGFGAGRIVAVRRIQNSSQDSPSGDWEIVVQPTTLVSSQAVTTAVMNPNPWIGKLELTQ